MSIDTLAMKEDLEKAGVPEAKATAHTKAHQTTYDQAREGLATKADLDVLAARLEGKIDTLRAEMFKWGASAMLVLLAAMYAIR